MASNSKLTRDQKAARKEMREELLQQGGSIVSSEFARMTVVTFPQGNVTAVYSSVASPDEIKFRRKVGEYHALMRCDSCNPAFILPGRHYALDVLDMFLG